MPTTDITLLRLLKEIIAIKYLDTTLFSKQVLITHYIFRHWLTRAIIVVISVNSRIQGWSAEYLPAISRTRVHPGSSSVGRCPSLSEFISVTAGVSELTPDGHALLVIRCIECIAAHSVEVSHREIQRMRQQMLQHCTSEG